MQGIVLIISNSAGICEIIELNFRQAFGTIQQLVVSLILALLLAFVSLFLLHHRITAASRIESGAVNDAANPSESSVWWFAR